MEQVKKTARQIKTTTSEPTEIKSNESESEDDEDLIGPPVPQLKNIKIKKSNKTDDNSDEDTDSEGESDTEPDLVNKIPASHEVGMNHGLKAVTAISADPSGARLGKIIIIYFSEIY